MPAAYVQHAVNASVSNGGTTAFGSNVTVGNTIVAMVGWSYNACPPSLADNLGNTYTAVKTGGNYWVFVAPVTTGGSCTITLSAGCSQGPVAFVEASGLQATPYDGAAGPTTNVANNVTSGSVTTTANGDLVLGFFSGGAGSPTYTPVGGFTELYDSGGLQLQYLVQASAGAINPSATASNNADAVVGYTAAFKASAAATTAFPALGRYGTRGPVR